MNRRACRAIRDGKCAAVAFAAFLRVGADPHCAEFIEKAAQASESHFMIELLRVGASPNAFLAKLRHSVLLLARGADPSLVLLNACDTRRNESMADLSVLTASLDAGADVNAVDSAVALRFICS
jgi:hypothetical protein